MRNGSNGHLVGPNVSLADLGLLEVILTIEELIGEDELKPYPEILVNINFFDVKVNFIFIHLFLKEILTNHEIG